MYFKKVRQFHTLFGHLVNDRPTIPEDWQLRKQLIEEETKEVFEAIEKGDIQNLLKELCDLMYVVAGLIIACGFEKVFDDAFQEVHRSNMSKSIEGFEKARQDAIPKSKGTGKRIEVKELKTGLYGIYNESGKLIKPSTYSKADMGQFF